MEESGEFLRVFDKLEKRIKRDREARERVKQKILKRSEEAEETDLSRLFKKDIKEATRIVEKIKNLLTE